jgi:hypothetical protein
MVARLFHGDKPSRTRRAESSASSRRGSRREVRRRHEEGVARAEAPPDRRAWRTTGERPGTPPFVVLRDGGKTEVGRKDDGVKTFASEQKLKSADR